MRGRKPIVILLLMAMSLTATIRTPARTQDEPRPEQDLSVAPYEEYEARAIAAIFKEQLENGNDIAPLIDKYFVNDFDGRFAREAAEHFWFPAKPAALTQASRTDARRYYVALTNFQFLMMRLGRVVEKQYKAKQLADGTEVSEDDISLEKLFPPDVIDAFKSNPHLAQFIKDNNGERTAPTDTPETAESADVADEKATQPSDEDKHTIKFVYELRDLCSAMETAAGRMRAYLNSLPAEQTALESLVPVEDEDEPTTGPLSYGVGNNAYIVDEEEFYGAPKGTRLICAHVFSLHMDLIRVEGELKVLSVYMQMSD